MTPQNDAKYTSLLFTPRTTESARGLPDYRCARGQLRSTVLQEAVQPYLRTFEFSMSAH